MSRKVVNGNTTLDELYAIAVDTVMKEIEIGEEFMVKDLFRGFEWNRIPKGIRTKLGSMFLSYVNREVSAEYVPVRKTPQNQQVYTKIR